jgi:hypothetical protein
VARRRGADSDERRAVVQFASTWRDMFSLPLPVGEKVLRSLLVFVFLVIALRLGGKREIGQITTLDLVVLLLVSNVLQNAMIGNDNSVIGGLIGAATLLGANFLLVRVTFNSSRARAVIEGVRRSSSTSAACTRTSCARRRSRSTSCARSSTTRASTASRTCP